VCLAEWIEENHEQRMAATRVLVLHKALEFEPNFMGGLLHSGFMKRAMQWFYRFITRRKYNLSIQKATSIGQKLQDGLRTTWRRCVTEMFELRRREDIVSDYNRQRPGQTPVDILPVSHVCNFDQSPQSVEPIATTTLGVPGAGEAPINTGGRENDWVTSQFVNIACEQNGMHMYHTAGGLTPKFQILDSAPN
jgi:hypothetical protein